ncbi:MAG: YHYH domain-containing protein [Lachnospiraceae bacterium]|nr:YHYH domain-containing protein [Lachnospiraceae bacterium]
MKTKIAVFVFFILLFSICNVVYAHPGMTDSSGGHYDRSTGEYHYHHGEPAHQHTNGECPYDFKDTTGQNSGSSSSGSKETSNITHSENNENNESTQELLFLSIIIVIIIFPIFLYALGSYLEYRKNKQIEKEKTICYKPPIIQKEPIYDDEENIRKIKEAQQRGLEEKRKLEQEKKKR